MDRMGQWQLMGFDIVSYLMGAEGAGFGEKPFDLVSYLMGQSDYSVVERTASGAVAHITDAIAAPFKGIVAQITPVQSGSGDPSPTNVRPISGWSAVNIYHAGVNYPKSGWQRGYSISATDGELKPQTNYEYYASPLIPLTSAKKLYIDIQMGASGYRYLTVCTYDSNGDYIETLYNEVKASNAHVVMDYTAGSTAAFIRMSCGVGVGTINYCTTDLSTVTFTVPSDPGTIYGGTLSIAEDGSVTLTKTMGYVNLGTYTWSKNSAGGDHAFRASLSSRKVGLGTKAICEGYEFEGNFILDDIAAGPDMRLYFQRTNTNFWIKDSNFSDAATLKTSLSGVHLVYELAEPTVYTLTPITPLTALAGENNLWADSGDISVTYIADGRASNQLAVSMLLGRSYQHDPSDPDDATAAEALSILTGGDTR